MNPLHTCVDIIKHIETFYSNPTALNKQEDGHWIPMSTEEFVINAKALAVALNQSGVSRGDRVGILANSSPEWTLADVAIMLAGGVCVPLFANISDENFVYEVKEADIKVLFVEGEEQWQVFNKHEDFFDLSISLDKGAPVHSKVKALKELLSIGRQRLINQPNLCQQLQEAVRPTDLAMIIYTSGSTGTPKGVELTHENIICEVAFDKFHWDACKDRYLSVLPLAHVFGHCINLWMLAWGVSIYYTSDYKNLGEICREVKPTATAVVPRLLEKIYMKMVDNLHNAHGIKRWIGEWAFKLANKEQAFLKKLLFPIVDKLVYTKLREALGGQLRVTLSGGAPLNPHLHRFFNEIGIPIYEGWGLTEACPVCVNFPGHNYIGTVGPVLPGQQIVISPDSEVLVRGSLVMRGYYGHPEQSANTIDKEGWLHTGDRGVIDSNGDLKILGRMKELYKTSTGEYVAPVPIEQMLCRFPLIEMAMVIAEERKFTSCLLFPNFDVMSRMKKKLKVNGESDETFLQSSIVSQQINDFINDINKHLNHWEQIQAYKFILEPLTIQSGELTPSMKIRREVVSSKYRDLIDAMYQEK